MRYVVLVWAFVLTGCASMYDVGMEHRREIAADQCKKLGYQPGTERFQDCQLKFLTTL